MDGGYCPPSLAVSSKAEHAQGGEPVLGDLPDHPVIDLAALLQHGQLVGTEPSMLGVLAALEARPVEVAVDPDQKVGLEALEAILAGIRVVAHHAEHHRDLPAGPLRLFPPQRLFDRFAWLHVAADDVPRVREELSQCGPFLEENPPVVVHDKSPRDAERLGTAPGAWSFGRCGEPLGWHEKIISRRLVSWLP